MAGGDEAEAEDSEVVGELGVRAIKENIFLEKGFGVEWGEECREFLLISTGLDSSVFLQNHLLHLYSNCNLIDDACWVFNNIIVMFLVGEQ
ncbi:hypothetical protein CFP56_019238 [Quercus suber]|uniref:Uncharacterized protein n=1 Tax=Quercus suber TaxID=58331 RepID=A0AAW0KHQ6_QUESU